MHVKPARGFQTMCFGNDCCEFIISLSMSRQVLVSLGKWANQES